MRFVFGTRFYSIKGVSGMCFYPLEMMQCLKDMLDIETVEFVLPEEMHIHDLYFNNKYTALFPITNTIRKSDVLFLTINLFVYLMETNPNILFDVKAIYIINAYRSLEVLIKRFFENQQNLVRMSRLIDKIFLLHEPGFENGLIDIHWFHKEVVNIKRGIYTKYWRPDKDTKIDSMYVYRRYDIGEMEKPDTWFKARMWMEETKKRYVFGRFQTPERVCSEFLYLRYIDYMPRLPFEFWFYEKPVTLFDISDGLKKKLPTVEFPLKEPFILNRSEFPNWELSNLIGNMVRMGVL